MEAQRILMPFYFPWFRYQWDIFASVFFHVPPFSESKLFILHDDYLQLKKKYIFWKDFWANLSRLGPFLNLRLG